MRFRVLIQKEWRRRGAAIFVACIGLALSGCDAEPALLWSKQVTSPNGEYKAVAESRAWTGPGANFVETVVHVDDGIGRDKKSSEVFAFADAGPSLGLSMRWVSPSRLLIVIKEDPRYVEYQVVKAMGVDISLKYDGRSSAGGIRKLRTSRSSAMTNV